MLTQSHTHANKHAQQQQQKQRLKDYKTDCIEHIYHSYQTNVCQFDRHMKQVRALHPWDHKQRRMVKCIDEFDALFQWKLWASWQRNETKFDETIKSLSCREWRFHFHVDTNTNTQIQFWKKLLFAVIATQKFMLPEGKQCHWFYTKLSIFGSKVCVDCVINWNTMLLFPFLSLSLHFGFHFSYFKCMCFVILYFRNTVVMSTWIVN